MITKVLKNAVAREEQLLRKQTGQMYSDLGQEMSNGRPK